MKEMIARDTRFDEAVVTMGDSTCPPGWTYNPSSWAERLWIAAVAGGGLLISGYLALYPVEVIE